MTGHGQGVRLELREVFKRFGAREVLRGIDLEQEPGEFIALVGKSGCGKSTLLRLIAGLERPSQGCIQVDGQTVQGLQPHARMMFQDARLLPWKRVRENVALGLPKSERERANHALEHVGLSDRAQDWPGVLSGGQRQRVALARALASRPRLLLLDEPLGALDALTRREMQHLLEALWQEQRFTALLVTHDVEEAVALADQVVLIEDGVISARYPVNLPRPRARGSLAFASIKEDLLCRVQGGQILPSLPFSFAPPSEALNAEEAYALTQSEDNPRHSPV